MSLKGQFCVKCEQTLQKNRYFLIQKSRLWKYFWIQKSHKRSTNPTSFELELLQSPQAQTWYVMSLQNFVCFDADNIQYCDFRLNFPTLNRSLSGNLQRRGLITKLNKAGTKLINLSTILCFISCGF